MGSSLPEESGGSGVSNVAYGLILHELERGDSGLQCDFIKMDTAIFLMTLTGKPNG